MPDRSRKRRPRDPNQLAKLIVDLATGEASEAEAPPELDGKNPAAVALGRIGGLKGGKRAQVLHLLCEGNSMRTTSCLADVAFNSVKKLLIDAGNACSEYQDRGASQD